MRFLIMSMPVVALISTLGFSVGKTGQMLAARAATVDADPEYTQLYTDVRWKALALHSNHAETRGKTMSRAGISTKPRSTTARPALRTNP
jgi:hypothetical protein